MKKWLWIIPVAALLSSGLWVAKELYSPYRGYTDRLVLVIQPGTSAPAVAESFVRHGVLAYRFPFLFRTWIGRHRRETIKFGEYLFDRPLTALQVYRKLARGEVYLRAVVIPEGSDRFDMARIYQQTLGLDPQVFMTATRDPASIRDLDPQATSLEGYLFPDTYRFPRGVSPAVVVQTMLARFRRVLKSQFADELPAGPNALHNVMTLASLVEKETPSAAERPMIAGVFLRRLKKGMPLQCDPTVGYAVEASQNWLEPFHGAITQADLEINSPYNTYAHAGLPPGPICSPGAASIQAALHPAQGKALYFVSNNHGGHVFADTLAQHERNVARYRREVEAAAGRDAESHGPSRVKRRRNSR